MPLIFNNWVIRIQRKEKRAILCNVSANSIYFIYCTCRIFLVKITGMSIENANSFPFHNHRSQSKFLSRVRVRVRDITIDSSCIKNIFFGKDLSLSLSLYPENINFFSGSFLNVWITGLRWEITMQKGRIFQTHERDDTVRYYTGYAATTGIGYF